jgi:hypothetical protein
VGTFFKAKRRRIFLAGTKTLHIEKLLLLFYRRFQTETPRRPQQ